MSSLLTIGELSQFLKISEATIYYWVSRRQIPYTKFGRHLRFRVEEVLRYFEEQTMLGKSCSSGSPAVFEDLGFALNRSLTTRNEGHAQLPEKE